MGDKELRIRVGASVDASLTAVFTQLAAAAKAAQKQMAAAMAAGGKAASAGVKAGTKESEDALKNVGKTAKEQADAMAKDVARAAKERIRAEREANREVERDLARHMKEQEKLRNAEGGKSGGGGRRRGFAGYGEIGGVAYNRSPIKNDSLILRGASAAFGAGKRFAGDALRGVGVETNMAARLGGAVERETLATKISNTAWINQGGVESAKKKVDPSVLMADANRVGSASGTDAKEILDGIEKFVALTGDLQTARDSMGEIGKLAKANGADFSDMMEAAAAISTSMGEVPDKGAAVAAVMRTVAGQGQLGAMEISKMAHIMGKLTAQANFFELDDVSKATLNKAGVKNETGQRVAMIGALAQVARGKGGKTSEATAMNAAMAFANDLRNPNEIKRLNAMGIDPYTDKSHTKTSSLPNIILEIAKRAQTKGGLNMDVLKAAVPNKNAASVLMGASQTYNQAYDASTETTEKGKHAQAMQALSDSFQGMLGVTQSLADTEVRFGAAMKTNQSQVSILNNQLGRAAEETATKLLPIIRELTPAFLEVTGAMKGAVSWIADKTGIKDLLGKQGTDSAAVAAEIRARNATGIVKQGIRGEHVMTDADNDEVTNAQIELQKALAAKVKAHTTNSAGELRTAQNNADVRDDQNGVLAKRAADGDLHAQSYLHDKEQIESMKQTLVELQNRQNEAWLNKNKEAYDRALRGGPPIRVVIANPPSAQPLTGGTMPVDSR